MTSEGAAPGSRPLVLAPFRGLRFDADRVGDLGTVISPPYDVLDADTVRRLESANRRNIVRLILSRRFERPYLAVRRRLEQWRDKEYLRADDDPALYLYQYTVGEVTARGLIGALALREETERVVLPHEDVMAGPVEDRAVLMRTTESNLEPILLVQEGSSALRALLSDIAASEPLADFVALDGSRHVLWAEQDPATHEAVAAALHGGQALIADGHHRYAAYLRLQREARDLGAGDSPWDYGLAMLVDQHDYPLAVGPIHRSVAALTVADVLEVAAERGEVATSFAHRGAAFAHAEERRETAADAVFVLSDGRDWVVLETARTHEVDTAVLHDTLFEAWDVADEQVGYHHSVEQALQMTERQPTLVVAVHPPSVADVMEASARGRRLPRKSTSFFPKPRMGVVMRDLRDA